MPYYSDRRSVVYQFGPGPLTPAVKLLLYANVSMFVLTWLAPGLVVLLGLQPYAVVEGLRLWQPVTYMFIHAGVMHILFNMLALWMFGVGLERLWGRDFFLKYYFITGIGAAATTILLAFIPGAFGATMWMSVTVGASGAIYGLLVAYALYFPDVPIYLWALIPIPARVFVLIMGAIAFMSSVSGNEGGIANTAHLGGLVVGYVYLKTRGGRPLADLNYRYTKWRMNRVRRRFEVREGGRHDWDRRVH
jgi:membrane associated rhomboid family serine protease